MVFCEHHDYLVNKILVVILLRAPLGFLGPSNNDRNSGPNGNNLACIDLNDMLAIDGNDGEDNNDLKYGPT